MTEQSYDMAAVKDAERLYLNTPAGRMLNPISQAVIQVMVMAGMDEITESNLSEIHHRTCMLSTMGICYIQMDDENGGVIMRNPIQPELEAHVGIKVKADRLTQRKFYNRLINYIKDAAKEFAESEAKMLETLSEEPEPESNLIDASAPEIWTPGSNV